MNAIGLQELVLVIAAMLANLPGALTGTVVGPFLKLFWLFLLRGA